MMPRKFDHESPTSGRPTSFDWTEAARLYRSGWTLAKVGRHFGVSHVAVYIALKALGVPRRKVSGPGRNRVFDHDKIVELFMADKTPCAIARELGASTAPIYRVLRIRRCISPRHIPPDLDDEAVEVFLDGYADADNLTVSEALALARHDMAERKGRNRNDRG